MKQKTQSQTVSESNPNKLRVEDFNKMFGLVDEKTGHTFEGDFSSRAEAIKWAKENGYELIDGVLINKTVSESKQGIPTLYPSAKVPLPSQEYIDRAVNSYDDMLEALQNVYDNLGYMVNHSCTTKWLNEQIDILEKPLHKAKATKTPTSVSQSKHTHGTWETDGLAIVGPRPELEICVCTSDKDVSRTEAEANACLIAAAPDMLEALQTIVDNASKANVPDEYYLHQIALDNCKRVVAKATNNQ